MNSFHIFNHQQQEEYLGLNYNQETSTAPLGSIEAVIIVLFH